MAGYKSILFDKSGGVAYLSLNRPHVLNAYNMEMRDEFHHVLTALNDDPDVHAVVVRGEGQAFCAGADLTEFGTAPSLTVARAVRWERDVWGAFLAVQKPTIASIHGYCLGSGVEIALLCDIRIASEDAIFGMPEVSLGMIPAAGGTQTMPRALGPSRALELLLTGRRIKAHEALDWGLVSRVVCRERLDYETRSVADSVLSSDMGVVYSVKKAVWQGSEMSVQQALHLETRLAVSSMTGSGRGTRSGIRPQDGAHK